MLPAVVDARLCQIRFWVREFLGENAYDRYLVEWHRRHTNFDPGGEHRPLSEREFFTQRIEDKYSAGGGRCC
jgi:uncharacterized short protein YbdD (DUF466 family)